MRTASKNNEDKQSIDKSRLAMQDIGNEQAPGTVLQRAQELIADTFKPESLPMDMQAKFASIERILELVTGGSDQAAIDQAVTHTISMGPRVRDRGTFAGVTTSPRADSG